MMSMFGKSAGLMETPAQREERERLAMMFGDRPAPEVNSFGIDPATQGAIGQAASMPVQDAPERWIDGGKFSGKDALGLALGAIGDAFSRNAGGEATTAPMLFRGMADSRKAKEAAAQAQAERADWVWKQQYQAQNRPPAGPPTFLKNLEAWKQLDPRQQQEVAKMQSILNPGFMTGADGLPYQRPPAQVGAYDGPEWEDVSDEEAAALSGGGAGNGAGGFPASRIPSGSPLDPWAQGRR